MQDAECNAVEDSFVNVITTIGNYLFRKNPYIREKNILTNVAFIIKSVLPFDNQLAVLNNVEWMLGGVSDAHLMQPFQKEEPHNNLASPVKRNNFKPTFSYLT